MFFHNFGASLKNIGINLDEANVLYVAKMLVF